MLQLSPEETLCANIVLKRSADVAAVKSATLNAFDYYKPGKYDFVKSKELLSSILLIALCLRQIGILPLQCQWSGRVRSL